MKLKINELLAREYGRVFNYPLTVKEARLWEVRKIREDMAQHKERIAREQVSKLAKIPTIMAVFLTGSVAAGNARDDADIDLMIITQPNSLWLTRLLMVIFLKMKKIYGRGGNNICPNIFLDTNHLEIQNRNLYTAHEILQAKCLFDRGGIYRKWLGKNSWTKEYLPNATRFSQSKMLGLRPLRFARGSRPALFARSNRLLLPLESLAFVMQFFYMRSKMTNEQIGLHQAFFHPSDLSERVLKSLRRRLKKLGIIEE
ncbi:MAG: nucleotidyltransferase domain-containing protein [Patescibacteria group bacterium]|nr:nucleotidyltransferase domain-containing protein [Patescibacteria group bacterium]MCL5431962.1 nucleotidyltransferase domain-containing protein [Patescibacteria group bacterium]